MIIVHLSGGLGNQMFQYAFGLATATRLGISLKLELNDSSLHIHNGYELGRVFDIRAMQAGPAETDSILGLHRFQLVQRISRLLNPQGRFYRHYVEEPHFHFSPQLLEIPDQSYIRGYWQSEKYFARFESGIRACFAFKQPLRDLNLATADRIGDENSVSLHIRRNDFANNSIINEKHGLCSLEYYRVAIEYVAQRIERPVFYVFSDDMKWVKSNLEMSHPHCYVENNTGANGYIDMQLMSLCRHNIIANSSFSWWAAWLNSNVDKMVLTPKKWFLQDIDTSDLIPQGWISL